MPPIEVKPISVALHEDAANPVAPPVQGDRQ
jgi:hypothetical protein